MAPNIGTDALKGKAQGGSDVTQAHRAMGAAVSPKYAAPEFAVPNASNDFDVKGAQAPAFVKVPIGHNFTIRTDQDITFKFNSAAEDPISLSAAEGVFSWTHTEFENIFITNNSGFAANIKIVMS